MAIKPIRSIIDDEDVDLEVIPPAVPDPIRDLLLAVLPSLPDNSTIQELAGRMFAQDKMLMESSPTMELLLLLKQLAKEKVIVLGWDNRRQCSLITYAKGK